MRLLWWRERGRNRKGKIGLLPLLYQRKPYEHKGRTVGRKKKRVSLKMWGSCLPAAKGGKRVSDNSNNKAVSASSFRKKRNTLRVTGKLKIALKGSVRGLEGKIGRD